MHYVNDDLDAGPIVLQKTVAVLDGETSETLAARILEQEHGLYVEAVRQIVTNAQTVNAVQI